MSSDADFQWLIDHGPEIDRQYAGKWIAVHDGKVIGTGNTATEAAAEARRTSPDAQFILEGVDSATDVIYAGV